MSDTPEITIRQVTANDIDALTSIRLASFSEADSAITWLGYKASHRFLQWLTTEAEGVIPLCAEMDGNVVGYGIIVKRLEVKPFVRKNIGFFVASVLTQPWLFAKPFFRRKVVEIISSLLSFSRKTNNDLPPVPEDIPGYNPCRMLDTAVHPDYQGYGIGTMLLKAREQAALQYGYTHAGCGIRPNNPRGVTWHERYGYKVVEIKPDSIRMEKKLVENIPAEQA